MRYILAALVMGFMLGSAAFAADSPPVPAPPPKIVETVKAPTIQGGHYEQRCSGRQCFLVWVPESSTVAPPLACTCAPGTCTQGGTCTSGQCGMAGCGTTASEGVFTGVMTRHEARVARRAARRGGC